ncbi:MAG: peptidoglycan-binding protein [Oscillospiraceae bacterium]|jgi:murein L,D-transpeptidase YcbB/YkuD|nr:peptidoglycan-binding protein [Oscillospiraceae bacterium]
MASFPGARVVGGALNLRASASASATILATIPNNTSLNVSDNNADWLSTTYSGNSGYVVRQYVDTSRSSNRTLANVFSNNTLVRGNTGQYIYNLQHYLNRYGYGLTCDGIFGSGTENAVKGYQNSYGLTADGQVGASTKSDLLTRTST